MDTEILDGFNGGGGSEYPQMPASTPRKISNTHEIKVLEGISEHKNSRFFTKFFGASPQTNYLCLGNRLPT